MRIFRHEFGQLRSSGRRSARASAWSTKTRAEASQVWPAANSTQACRGMPSASRQAARRSSLSTPTGAAPMTSRGPGDRKRRDRQAAGQRLEQHQAEGVGLAREHEDVGGRIDLGQFLAVPRAEEHRLRIFPLQRRARRPVADDQLGAGQIEIEERLEILLDRDAADAEKHRRRQAEVDLARMEQRRCRRRATTAPHCESRASAIRPPAPALPPSPPGSAGGTSAAPPRPRLPGSASAPRHIPESGCESSS